MRMRLSALALSAALALAGCSSLVEGPPTPEPFVPPSSPTPRVAATAVPATVPTAVPVTMTTAVVERGDVIQTLVLDGEVIAPRLRPLSFTQAGQVADIKIGGPGKVSAGQLLAELSMVDLQPQLDAAQADYDRANAALVRAQSSLNIPVRQARLALQEAEDDLAQVRRPATPEALAAGEAAVNRAEANLAKTRNDASAAKTSAELAHRQALRGLENARAELAAATAAAQAAPDDAAKAAALRAAEAAVWSAEQAVAQAKITLDTALGNEIAVIKAAEAALDEARVALARLRALPDKFEVRKAERAVEAARITLADAQARAVIDPDIELALQESTKALDALKLQIEGRRLYAPADGEITELIVKPGAALQPGDAVMQFSDPTIAADLREIWVTQVPNVTSLREGQEVAVNAASAENIAGRVARILTDATSGLSTLQISFPNTKFSGDPGERASVAIILNRQNNVLWLPPGAIQNDGQPFVVALINNSQQRVAVVLGVQSDERVEIASGLTEGQKVVMP